MKKSKFDKIIEDMNKSAKEIMDNANDLIQDKNIAEADCYALKDIVRDVLDIMGSIKTVKSYGEKNSNEVEEVYNFDKDKFKFDNEGVD